MILLSFDTEEFDVPREHGVEYDTIRDGMKVSITGTNRILDVLKAENVRATFFCTANFAENAPDVMRRIADEGHEIAAHGCDHWQPREDDVIQSHRRIEAVMHNLGYDGLTVRGYRQPRMFPVSDKLLHDEGYRYNSSLNPAFIPGRYMHLTAPRTPFWAVAPSGNGNGLLQIPASVTPYFRFPLFWLAMHNLPMWLYKAWCRWTWRHDGQFVTYFHPWEFFDLKEHPEFHMPFIIRNHSGQQLARRLHELIRTFKSAGAPFVTYSEYTTRFTNPQENE